MTPHEIALSMRWGRLLAALNSARHALAQAYNERYLLQHPEAVGILLSAHHGLAGVEQHAWREFELYKNPPRKIKKRRARK